jgi:major membrane immunogen (membrane-anchored lipoprotein)
MPTVGLSSRIAIPSEIEIGVPYAMPIALTQGDDPARIGTVVRGFQYEMKGNVITPMSTGSYYFGYFFDDAHRIDNGSTFVVKDSTRPEIILFDDVQMYQKRLTSERAAAYEAIRDNAATTPTQMENALAEYLIRIPRVSVIDAGGISEFKVTVKNRDGTVVNPESDIPAFDGEKYFRPTDDGVYTITYEVLDFDGNSASLTVSIPVGKLIAPTLSLTQSHSANPRNGYEFRFSPVRVTEAAGFETSEVTVTVTLFHPSGREVATHSGSPVNGVFTPSDAPHVLTDAGIYRAEYRVRDRAGNETVEEVIISIPGASGRGINYQILSTVLIIVAILMVVFVLLYFFRFRRIKE